MITVNKSNPFSYERIEEQKLITFAQQREAVYTEAPDPVYDITEEESFVYNEEAPETPILTVDGYNPAS